MDPGDPPPATARRWGMSRGWRRVAPAAAAGLLVGAALVAAGIDHLFDTTPTPPQIRQAQTATPSVVLSADGQTLARLSEGAHEPVPLERIAPAVVNALLATEDHRFRAHGGVDLRRLAGAALATLRGTTQGASTLTQQLARNLFPDQIGRERSMLRKAREIATALRIERMYSKDQILAAYLNSAPFLYNVSGIEMAARTYFDKTAAQLDTLESATLVGMLKGAHFYDPARHPQRSRERRNLVLAQMVRHGTLDGATCAQLRDLPLALQFRRVDQRADSAPHFVAHVRRQLNAWADRHHHDLYRDGLVIETTLDARLQSVAEAAVAEQAAALQRVADTEWSQKSMPALSKPPAAPAHTPFAFFWRERPDLLPALLRETAEFRKARQAAGNDAEALRRVLANEALVERVQARMTRLEAGFVALEPQTGAVRAWVGSRDFARDQFDHVAQARRQPGSTFKAFVYGAALERGLSPDQTYVDEAVVVPLADGTLWEPSDMGGATGLTMSLREGLALSKNSITTQVMQQTGLPAIVGFARAAGVRQARLDAVPSLALGTSPVSLLEMAGAYGTLAALGQRREPVTIRRIKDRHGQVLADFDAKPETALPRPVAARLIDMLRDVALTGTAASLRSRFGLRGDIAAKTGTTQNNTDGWFLAMQPGLVSGAWVGFNDQRVRIRSDHWGQGANSALLIVGDFLRAATREGLVDAKARFPVERIEPLPTSQPDLPLAPAVPQLHDILPAAPHLPWASGAERGANS